MKNLYLILTILAISLFTNAQSELNFDSGLIENYSKNPSVVSLFKIESDYFLVRKQSITGPRGFDFYIEKFDEDLNHVRTLLVSGKEGKEERTIESAFQLGESIALIYSVNRPGKDKSTDFKIEYIDPESLTPQTNITLFSLPKEMTKYGHWLTYNVSKSGKYFTVKYTQWEGEPQGILAILHFSAEGEFISNLLTAISEHTKDSKLDQTLVADDGNVYLVLYNDQPEGRIGVKFKIMAIQGESFKNYPLNLDPVSVNEIVISEGESEGIIGAGTFNSTQNQQDWNYFDSYTKGIFTFRINANSESISFGKAHPFNYELAYEGWDSEMTKVNFKKLKSGDKKEYEKVIAQKNDYENFEDFDLDSPPERKNKIGIDDLYLREIMECNGEIFTLLDLDYISYFKAIVAVNFNANGTFQYEKKFGLNAPSYNAYTGNDEPYYLFKRDGLPAIIFRDNYKNAEPKSLEKEPYLKYDQTAYNGLVFDNPDPTRFVAFRLDGKPRIKYAKDITLTGNGTELLFITDLAGTGYRLSRVR
ncbi:MAG: hypothetical protein ACPGEG_01945 [Salibacteraceae bacterium]